ncbi:hypothetical protein SLEP1_g23694 [Rubroshorea leprosula]|uniref:Uncharacterized protein n=1 Tax=Rubroshorea leprosula TaxID=152421 RepID=A0AAV5JG85_9ROSI|nr:hypothetical protein SLEP1_g23694 [Rubroshorea leprosula]
MKSIQKALVALFTLILFRLLICLALSCHHDRNIPQFRAQPRRLLGSFASFPANQNKSSGATQDPKKDMEAGLKKAPPSASNPTQNK